MNVTFSANVLFNISNAHAGVVTTEIRSTAVCDSIPCNLTHVRADAMNLAAPYLLLHLRSPVL